MVFLVVAPSEALGDAFGHYEIHQFAVDLEREGAAVRVGVEDARDLRALLEAGRAGGLGLGLSHSEPERARVFLRLVGYLVTGSGLRVRVRVRVKG